MATKVIDTYIWEPIVHRYQVERRIKGGSPNDWRAVPDRSWRTKFFARMYASSWCSYELDYRVVDTRAKD